LKLSDWALRKDFECGVVEVAVFDGWRRLGDCNLRMDSEFFFKGQSGEPKQRNY
jgi:hypothetical protein